jgi:transcriptional regulator with XRE-family HTH domain
VRGKTSVETLGLQVTILLKEKRSARGFSLNALAQKSGLARQTISYLEQEEVLRNSCAGVRLKLCNSRTRERGKGSVLS